MEGNMIFQNPKWSEHYLRRKDVVIFEKYIENNEIQAERKNKLKKL